jgi:hypothetical protein
MQSFAGTLNLFPDVHLSAGDTLLISSSTNLVANFSLGSAGTQRCLCCSDVNRSQYSDFGTTVTPPQIPPEFFFYLYHSAA